MPFFNPQNRSPIPLGFVPLSDCAPLAVAKQSWLKQPGLMPGTVVEIVFLPPPPRPGHLASGHLDDYCVGELWNSESILMGKGWCAATSSQIASGHPETVLVAGGDLLVERYSEFISLTAAQLHACRLCQSLSFREEMIRILASEQDTGASDAAHRNSLGPLFNTGIDTQDASTFHLFHGSDLNPPTPENASWFLSWMRSADLLPDSTAGASLTTTDRHDLFRAASELLLPA